MLLSWFLQRFFELAEGMPVNEEKSEVDDLKSISL
jgi:hypothetical protein